MRSHSIDREIKCKWEEWCSSFVTVYTILRGKELWSFFQSALFMKVWFVDQIFSCQESHYDEYFLYHIHKLYVQIYFIIMIEDKKSILWLLNVKIQYYFSTSQISVLYRAAYFCNMKIMQSEQKSLSIWTLATFEVLNAF